MKVNLLKTKVNKNKEVKSYMSKVKHCITLMVMSIMAISLTACSDDAAKENVTIGLGIGSYSTSSIFDLILPKAHAAVSDLKICFKRLRFKLADEDSLDPDQEDNIDFNLGEVNLTDSGVFLGNVTIPAGNYKRIEFDLEDDCASGKSIDLTNGNGTFSSTDRITIKFSGNFTADDDGVLNLSAQNIIDALNSYNGLGPSLKDTAEAISGDL